MRMLHWLGSPEWRSDSWKINFLKPLPAAELLTNFSILLIILYWDCKLTILQHPGSLSFKRYQLNKTCPIDSFLIQKFPSTHQNHRFEYECSLIIPTPQLWSLRTCIAKRSKTKQITTRNNHRRWRLLSGNSSISGEFQNRFSIPLIHLWQEDHVKPQGKNDE
jgi:hypothetical protein